MLARPVKILRSGVNAVESCGKNEKNQCQYLRCTIYLINSATSRVIGKVLMMARKRVNPEKGQSRLLDDFAHKIHFRSARCLCSCIHSLDSSSARPHDQ